MDPAMTILNFIFNSAYIFFYVAALCVFLHCFYDTGFRWHWKKAIPLLAVAFLDSAILCFTSQLLYLFVSNLLIALQVLIAVYDYRGKKIFAVLRFVPAAYIITACTSLIGIVSAYLLLPNTPFDMLPTLQESLTMTQEEMNAFYFSFLTDSIPASTLLFTYILNAVFLSSAFFFLYCRLYKKQVVIRSKTSDLIFVAVYPVLCLILLMIFVFAGKDSRITLFILTGISILFGLMFPVFIFLTRIGQYYRDRAVYQENHMQAELSHFEQYKQNQEETARFRHDIRNNLLCLDDLLQEGRTQEAAAYLNDLLHTSRSLSPKFVSGDQMLDCILGVKDRVMEENRITFQLDGVLAGGLRWKPMDICNVFANALDNAIEACQQLPEDQRSINMSVRGTEQYWFVTVQNPAPTEVDTQQLFLKSGGFTSKADARQHGIGTYTMKTTVERYGGMLNAECADGIFTLEIMIDKGSSL